MAIMLTWIRQRIFSGILCIVPMAVPLEIDDIEVNLDNEKNTVSLDKSIVIDNTGLMHWYIGGMDDKTHIHYCNIHNEYEKVEIEWE